MVSNPFADGISIRISGDSSELTEAVDDANDSLGSLKNRTTLVGGALTALAVGGFAVAANEARKFQQRMVELEKVTNPETANAMSESIRRMAETIPLAQGALADIAADAGRFGVRGPDNIEKFTRSVAKMATATDLSTQEAGESLAKLSTLTKTPITEVENLGSAINELSNNFATSSTEIIDSMLRSSAAMESFGLGATDIAGLSAALNAVSESSERAGTRMRRLIQEISNPKKARDFASAMGMNVKEFRRLRDNAPLKLLMRLIKAFAGNTQEAKNLKKQLSTTSRQALTGLGSNLDGVRRSLNMAGSAFKQNTSLQKEFDKASKTFNARLKILLNRLRNVAITLGNKLLPALTKVVNQAARAVTKFQQLNKRFDGLLAPATLLATAISGLGLAIKGAIGAISVGAITSLGSALLTVGGPIAIITGAIVGLGLAWKRNLFGIQQRTGNLVSQIKSHLKTLQNTVLDPFLGWISSQWSEHFGRIETQAKKTFNTFKRRAMAIVNWAKPHFQNFLDFVAGAWREWGDEIYNSARFYFDLTKGIIEFFLDWFSTQVAFFLAIIRGDFDEALSLIEGLVRRTFDSLINFIERWGGMFVDRADQAVRDLKGLWWDFKDSAMSLIDAFIEGIKEKADDVTDSVMGIVNNIRDLLPSSDAKEGPLSDLTASGASLPETFAEGVRTNISEIDNAVTDAAAAATIGGIQAQETGNTTVMNIEVRAESRSGGRRAGRALVDELRSRGFNR